MTNLKCHLPLPIDWKMKDISTTETNFGELHDGRLELRIKHDILQGIASKCRTRRSFGQKLRCVSFAPHSFVVRGQC